MERPDKFDEDDLLAFSRGEAAPDLAAQIEEAAAKDPAFRAELAVMGELRAAIASATDGPDAREFAWRRLEAEIAKADTAPKTVARPQIWRIAAMFLGAIVIAQGAFITFAPGTGEAPVFQTVSEDVAGFTFSVAFAPDAPMAEVEALLSDTGARIVDGPSAIGLYRLSFATEEAKAAALEQLSTSALIELMAEE